MWVPPSAACPLSLVSYCRVSGPVSCGRAPGPRPPHWLESSLLPPSSTHSCSRRLAPKHTLTRLETASQDLFCHKVCFSFFPFHCHIPLLSMLWITGFHCLCLWAFPCCSPRFQFEHRLFLLPLLGLVFAGCGAGVRLGWWKRDLSAMGAFLCMWWVHVTPSRSHKLYTI